MHLCLSVCLSVCDIDQARAGDEEGGRQLGGAGRGTKVRHDTRDFPVHPSVCVCVCVCVWLCCVFVCICRHDLALFVFLKFISSIVPTIDYDFTMDIDMALPSLTAGIGRK